MRAGDHADRGQDGLFRPKAADRVGPGCLQATESDRQDCNEQGDHEGQREDRPPDFDLIGEIL